MTRKTILNGLRWGSLAMLGCAALVLSNGVADARPDQSGRSLTIVQTADLDSMAAAENGGRATGVDPQVCPTPQPPDRDPWTGRLIDRPDRWTSRGPVVTPEW